MKRYLYINLILIMLCGCFDSASQKHDEWLVSAGSKAATVSDFNGALEIAKAAYSQKVISDPKLLNAVKLRLLDQMIEEIILLEMADMIDVKLTDEELQEEIDKIKGQYSEEVFNDILLEQAISYNTWKKRLEVHLIIDKVINKVLKGKISLSGSEISQYYNESFKDRLDNSYFEEEHAPEESIKDNSDFDDQKDEEADINEIIIRLLRRNKKEDAYLDWLKEVKGVINVEINRPVWKKLTNIDLDDKK